MAVRFFPLYNIDQPVGPGRANRPDDVRLVQALMIEVSRFDANDWVADLPSANRTLSTSATFDDRLATWILTFQRWCVKGYGGSNFKADGVVDPMPAMSSVAVRMNFASGRISTLGFLCNRLWRHNRQAYMKIGDDYGIPWVPAGFAN